MIPVLIQRAIETAAQIRDPISAAAFAIVGACIAFWIAFKKRDKKTTLVLGLVLGGGIMFLGSLPLLSKLYLDTHGIYQVRVVVLGPDQFPVNNAVVVCSPGGEEKSIAGGWECDIAPRNRPSDRLFTAYASVKNAFLVGKGELHLSDDYNPVVIIHLEPETSAMVQGEVQDKSGRTLSGAWVSVVGHESERIQTSPGGGFALPAHAASGQMIKMHVEMKGYRAYEELQQAGDSSISIQLTE